MGGITPRRLALAGILLLLVRAAASQDQSEVFSRTEAAGAVVRATRVASPLRIDGRLDEEVYQTVPAISDFVQTLPDPGAASTERTEAWVLYDDDNFYVVCRCWDSAPPEQWVANDMRRDSQRLRDNDNFGVSLDTYHDRRNAFVFYTTPLGALTDQIFTDEGNPNRDWNQIWDVRTGRFEGGWTVEIAIPFKSLRYGAGPIPDLGDSDPPRHSPEERVDASDRAAARERRLAGVVSHLRLGDAGRTRGAARQQEHRDQAVRQCPIDDRSPGVSPRHERRRCRPRRRPEVRHHAEPDRRLHLQHRLRAGRSRRAAGQPDALCVELAGEARFLP